MLFETLRPLALKTLAAILIMVAPPIALSIASAHAHEVVSGPNGGPIVDLGSHHLELVARNGHIELFVTDAKGAPVNVANASANLVILAGTKKLTATLAPDGARAENGILAADLALSDRGPYTIVAVVTLSSAKPLQGKFKIEKPLASLALPRNARNAG